MQRRERNRAKGLVVDPTTALDLAEVKPAIVLKARGKALWKQFADDPPFWWESADIPAAGILCAATDQLAAAFSDPMTSASQSAAMLKEWRSLAGELGLTPTARGRLKLKEAQGVAAARKVEAMEAERAEREFDVFDVDDLVADG